MTLQENTLGQKFMVDATLYCDLQSAGIADDLQATTSYADVFEWVRNLPSIYLPLLLSSFEIIWLTVHKIDSKTDCPCSCMYQSLAHWRKFQHFLAARCFRPLVTLFWKCITIGCLQLIRTWRETWRTSPWVEPVLQLEGLDRNCTQRTLRTQNDCDRPCSQTHSPVASAQYLLVKLF